MAYSKDQIEKLFKEIIRRIEDGESVRAILRTKGMPSRRIFYQWIDKEEEKLNQYTRACNDRADAIFDEMLEIADSATDKENVNSARLRIDARKWVLGRMNPKKFSDKLDVTTNGDSINPFLALMQSATSTDEQ